MDLAVFEIRYVPACSHSSLLCTSKKPMAVSRKDYFSSGWAKLEESDIVRHDNITQRASVLTVFIGLKIPLSTLDREGGLYTRQKYLCSGKVQGGLIHKAR